VVRAPANRISNIGVTIFVGEGFPPPLRYLQLAHIIQGSLLRLM
jgi:hypothetical protein